MLQDNLMQKTSYYAFSGKLLVAGVLSLWSNIPISYIALAGIMFLHITLGFFNAWDNGTVTAGRMRHVLVDKFTVLIAMGSLEVLTYAIGITAESKGIAWAPGTLAYIGSTGALFFCAQEVLAIIKIADERNVRIPNFIRKAVADIETDPTPPDNNRDTAGTLSEIRKTEEK